MTKSSSQQRAGHSSQSARPAIGFNRWLLLSLILVVVAVAAVFGLWAYHLNTYTIPSASMLPGLQIGDRIEIDPEAYQHDVPDRGDVVVFDGSDSFSPYESEIPANR